MTWLDILNRLAGGSPLFKDRSGGWTFSDVRVDADEVRYLTHKGYIKYSHTNTDKDQVWVITNNGMMSRNVARQH